MSFVFDERPSDSPLVELIWHTHSASPGSFISVAVTHWEMVVMRQQGRTTLTVRGPETKATPSPIPADAEFFGIQFKLGTLMPHLPVANFVDRAANLPEASSQSFWLHGSAWQFPDFEYADTFIARLARAGLLAREPIVAAALGGQLKDLSPRSVQRRIVQATGLTQRAVCQIERARQAQSLLQRGVSILDTVEQAGYFDQPHLTRSLKHFVGQTPAQIARQNQPE